jgi:hypothetical protein
MYPIRPAFERLERYERLAPISAWHRVTSSSDRSTALDNMSVTSVRNAASSCRKTIGRSIKCSRSSVSKFPTIPKSRK